MLHLDNSLLFTKGSERACYFYPEDDSKLIKVLFHKKNKNDQNQVEYEYYQHLNKNNITFDHLAQCYGYQQTNFGKALVFEKVTDYTGEISKSFREVLIQKSLNDNLEEKLLLELKNYLFTNNILFADATTVNLLCKEYAPQKYKLVIIDGLGAKREGVKFFLYKSIFLYKKYKIVKQWKQFIYNIQKVKRKIELNQQL